MITEDLHNRFSDDGRATIKGSIRMFRKLGYYVLTIYAPSFLLVVTCFVGFWIPIMGWPARVRELICSKSSYLFHIIIIKGCRRCDASHVNNRYANWYLYFDRRSVYFCNRDMDGCLRIFFVHVIIGICLRHSMVSILQANDTVVLRFVEQGSSSR